VISPYKSDKNSTHASGYNCDSIVKNFTITGINVQLEIRIATKTAEADRGDWDQLSANRPFTSYDWYQMGEIVLAPILRWYLLVYDAGEMIARATFWLSQQEQLPISSVVERVAASLLFRCNPLLICRSPLVDVSGMILPEDSRRQDALRLICQAVREIANKHRVSFTTFDYLDKNIFNQNWQGEGFSKLEIEDPSTFLNLKDPNFDTYLQGLSKSAYKDYRRHRNQAEARGIQVAILDRVSDVNEALKLIRSVEKRHGSMPCPWARALLEYASRGGMTWLSVRKHDRLIGCGLILRDNCVDVATLLGLDYSEDYVYFQLMYAAIRYAIESGARSFRGGSGAYPFKQRLGFAMEDNNSLVFSGRGPFFQKLGSIIGNQNSI
jgi:predicted N-acyltransferase